MMKFNLEELTQHKHEIAINDFCKLCSFEPIIKSYDEQLSLAIIFTAYKHDTAISNRFVIAECIDKGIDKNTLIAAIQECIAEYTSSIQMDMVTKINKLI